MLRKLSLLAAGAIIAASGSVFAMDGGGVSISGEANFGVKFAESDDDSKSELQFHHEFKVTFAASGTTDGGIGFGGEMTLDNTESVTSGKVTPAKTGYIVKAADLIGPGKIAFEAKYGISVTGLSAGDVIETGSTTNLSGWGRTTNAALLARYAGTYKTEPPTVYTANAVAGATPSPSSLGAPATSGGIAAFLHNTDGNTIKDVTISAGSFGVNAATVKATIEDAPADGTTLAAGDTIVITDTAGNIYTLTYGDDVDDTDAINPGWAITAEDADGNSVDLATLGVPAGAYILETSNITVTDFSGSRLAGAEKVAASQAYIDSLSASVAASDKQKVNNHGEVYISMDMHKLTIGSDLDSADKLAGGLADPGFDGIGIDDVAEGPYGGSAADVRYDGDFGVASVAISYGDNAGDAAWAAGFSFNVEPVNFGAGFDSNGVMSVGMGFTQGAIAMNALYSTDSDHDEADNEGFACADVTNKGKASYSTAKANACTLMEHGSGTAAKSLANKPDLKNQAFGVDVSYQMSEATSLVLVAAQHKKESAHLSYTQGRDAVSANPTATPPVTASQAVPASLKWSTTSTTVDAFGVGFSHDLGGGATLKAGAGSVDSNAVADLGITMKF